MKILLRDPEKGLFYAGPEQWTGDHRQAADFENTSVALDEVCEARLTGMEVVMRFEDPDFEISLSIAGLGDLKEDTTYTLT